MKDYLKILKQEIPDYCEITACEQVPQGDLSSLPGMPVRDVPEHIRVCVTARPEPGSNIRIELWMPVTDWNGELVGVGNGGAAGIILPLMLVGPMRLGFSVVTTDLGTSAGPDCGIGNEAVWKDFGYRATHLMTLFAKLAVELYYDRPARYAFFMGGSTGGQQAFSEMQRYPEDYDGILACAPAYDRVNLHLAFLHDWQALNAPGVKAVTADDEKQIMQAFLEKCANEGGRQGEDGFFYRPDNIQVTRDVFKGTGLSEPQIEALMKVYEGCKGIYEPTLTPGSETSGFGIAHRCERENFAQGYFYIFRWVLGADFDFEQFDFDKDGETVRAALEAALSATDTNLKPFRDRGGKLLLIHGTADPIIPMTSSIRYYEAIREQMGDPRDFFRLFLVPGMAHLSGGPGLQDLFYGLPATPKDEKHLGLLALKAWVEDGKAPDELYPVAFKADDPLSSFKPDGVAWERKINPYS